MDRSAATGNSPTSRFHRVVSGGGSVSTKVIGRGKTFEGARAVHERTVSRRSARGSLVGLVVLLTLIWGTTWPLFPLAVREISVWTFRAISVAGAGLALLATAVLRGQSLRVPRSDWPVLTAAAVIYLVVWNVASTYAAVLIPSGQAALLGFTMPVWLSLFAWLLLGQRPDRRTALAVVLSGLGVALLIARGAPAYVQAPVGVLLGLLSAIGWALGTLVLKRWPVAVPSLVSTGWQLLIASIPITAVALQQAQGPWFRPTATTALVIGYITLVPMAVGNAAWFAIVGMLPANIAGLSAVLVPMVAMVSGAFVHGEPLGPVQWAAMLLSGCGLLSIVWRPESTAKAL